MAPGNPLLTQLVEIIVDECDEQGRLTREVCFREDGDTVPFVGGWGRNGELGYLTDGGEVDLSLPSTALSEWTDSFVANREE